jgi:hypothetical protein
LVLVKARPEPIRAEIISTPHPVASPKRSPRNILTPDLHAERPPSWWEPQADEDWRCGQWARFSVEYRAELVRRRLGPPFALRRRDEADAATLWEQYHFLKALAVRLDAGRGTEPDRVMFEAGLREYNTNFDRIAQRKTLPG